MKSQELLEVATFTPYGVSTQATIYASKDFTTFAYSLSNSGETIETTIKELLSLIDYSVKFPLVFTNWTFAEMLHDTFRKSLIFGAELITQKRGI